MGRGPLHRSVVTGGAGFIGSHLVDRLLAEGQAVLVVDDLSTGTVDHLSEAADLEQLDISTSDLEPVFRRWRPTNVYHLAAQASVPRSIADPLRDLDINVAGTFRVAMAARSSGVSRFVFVSSGGAVYGETRRAVDERARSSPTSYYGIHKLAAEGHVTLAGSPYAIARPSNVYGPRQAAGLEGAVVASFLEQAVRTGRLRIHGDGRQTRDFLYVPDLVEALWILGRTDELGIWNIAAGRSTTILELASAVERAVGRPLDLDFLPSRPGDVRHSAISAARMRSLGWKPSTRMATNLSRLTDALTSETVHRRNSV